MNHLPQQWKIDRIKDRVRFDYGDSLAAEDRNDGRIQVFGSNGVVGVHDRAITNGRTIIIGRKGSFGKVTWSDEPCFPIDTTYFVDSSQTKEELRWLFYALDDLQLDTVNFDSAVPGLSREVVYSLTLKYPPRPQQRRIAAYLDASCEAIDAVVTSKRDQLNSLEQLGKSVLHSAFALNGSTPKERIKDVVTKIGSGITPTGGATTYEESGIPLLRSQNIHFDGLRLDDVAFINEETHREMSNSQVKPKDVLLNITGASIGRCTYVPKDFGEANVNQHVCIIRPGPKVNHRFLAFFLSSPLGQGQILSSFTGASRQGLSHKDLGTIEIPLFSIQVQERIVDSLHDKLEQVAQLRQNLEAQIDTLTVYRKSLIDECVTGKRRITEADLNKVQAHG